MSKPITRNDARKQKKFEEDLEELGLTKSNDYPSFYAKQGDVKLTAEEKAEIMKEKDDRIKDHIKKVDDPAAIKLP